MPAVRKVLSDLHVLDDVAELVLQPKDESWGGIFIDLQDKIDLVQGQKFSENHFWRRVEVLASISEEDWSAMMDKDEAFDYLTLGVEQVTSNEDQSRPTLGAEQEVQTEVVEVDNEQVKLTPHRCSKGCKETSPPPPPKKKHT